MIALFLGGCGSTAAVERRVDELEQELRDLRRSHALVSQRVRDVDRLGQTTFLLQDSIEQLGLEVDRLQSQDTERNARLKATEAALFGDGPRTAGQAVAPLPRPVVPAPAAAAAPAGVAAPTDDPRGVYQEAYAAMDGGQLEAAIAGFERLLALAPKHDLADNAHYWLGEIFQRLGDVRTASIHFRSIIEEYAGGNKVPDALYKLGTLAEDAGNRDEAAAWYRKVVEQYAWSPVAEKASTRLGQAPANP
jgi:tol-pal system protein YbgF